MLPFQVQKSDSSSAPCEYTYVTMVVREVLYSENGYTQRKDHILLPILCNRSTNVEPRFGYGCCSRSFLSSREITICNITTQMTRRHTSFALIPARHLETRHFQDNFESVSFAELSCLLCFRLEKNKRYEQPRTTFIRRADPHSPVVLPKQKRGRARSVRGHEVSVVRCVAPG